jgi:hypothetical protein
MDIAQAQDTMNRALPPITLAQLMTISKNISLHGAISEQEAFKQGFSEIRGMVTRAQAKGAEAVKLIMPQVVAALHKEIIDNSAYDKFKIVTADGVPWWLVPGNTDGPR